MDKLAIYSWLTLTNRSSEQASTIYQTFQNLKACRLSNLEKFGNISNIYILNSTEKTASLFDMLTQLDYYKIVPHSTLSLWRNHWNWFFNFFKDFFYFDLFLIFFFHLCLYVCFLPIYNSKLHWFIILRKNQTFPCVFVLKMLPKKHRAVCCDICNLWVHIKCNNITEYCYGKLQNDKESYCKICIKIIVPFLKLSDN